LAHLLDRLLGLGLLSLAVTAVLSGQAATLVGLTVVALNATAGWLFLRRREATARPRWPALALACASLPAGAVALWLAPDPASWPVPAVALFAAGGLGVIASLAALGTSFGVLPARRAIVSGGPFRLVRHPTYLCELGMVAACAWAAWSPWSVAALVLAIAGVVSRVHLEEGLLGAEPAYESYARRVRWRLVPKVW
jgi:protein-S-isoprenylcysteine O-methyltransferase Ste14